MRDQEGSPAYDSAPPLVFSVKDDQVWASFPGHHSMRLGPYEAVKEMMREFLEQSEIGERLISRDRQ